MAHMRLERRVQSLEQRVINGEYDRKAYCMLHDEDFISGDELLEDSELGKYYKRAFAPEGDDHGGWGSKRVIAATLLAGDMATAAQLRTDAASDRGFSRGDLLMLIIRHPNVISAPTVTRALDRWKLWRDERLLLCLRE